MLARFVTTTLLLATGCGPRNAANAPSPTKPPAPAPSALSARPPTPMPVDKAATAPSSSSFASVALIAEAETPEARLAFWKSLFQSQRHHPAALDAKPRPSRIAVRPCACRVSRARHAEGYLKKREQFDVLLVKGAPPAPPTTEQRGSP